LPDVAADCEDAPDRKLAPMKSSPIADQSDAALCRSKPRLGVSKGHEKGKEKSG
jgi:hypothetical protein